MPPFRAALLPLIAAASVLCAVLVLAILAPPDPQRTGDAGPTPSAAQGEPARRLAVPAVEPEELPDATRKVVSALASAETRAPTPEAMTRFEKWASQSTSPDSPTYDSWLSEGIQLAETRRAVMRELIQRDPERAIQLAVTPRLRSGLPSEVAALMEREVRGVGNYEVTAVCNHDPTQGHGTGCRAIREAILDEEIFQASVYGARLQKNTELQVPLYGVAIGDEIALAEGGGVILPAHEALPGESDGKPYVLYHGGETYAFEDPSELAALWEQPAGEEDNPTAESGPVFDPDSQLEGTTPPSEPFQEFSSWYKGPKTIMVLRVTPSDGAVWTNPPSESTLSSQLNETSQFFYEQSYRQKWFGPKIKFAGTENEVVIPRLGVSPVLRLPKTGAEYRDKLSTLVLDAVVALRAMGGQYTGYQPLNPDFFDRLVVISNVDMTSSAGLASVRGRNCWTGGGLGGPVAIHELVHNWGLWHANFWDHEGVREPRAPDNVHIEYGDGADIMGSTILAINPVSKEIVTALEKDRGELHVVNTSGVYRLFDHVDAHGRNPTSLRRALILPITGDEPGDKRLFLGFRHMNGIDGGPGRADRDRNAVQVHAHYPGKTGASQGSHFIDTTPSSFQGDDRIDGSIKIGRTYSESGTLNGNQIYGGFHVTPVARGSATHTENGTTRTHEWIDVVVNYQNDVAPNPSAPVVSLPGPVMTAQPGIPFLLAATASDPDGDPLAYDWDFGDGTYSILNSASQTKTWNTAGLYPVFVTVSDMKGRTASASAWVNVGNIPNRQPDPPAAALSGVSYRYYEGTWTSLPDFGKLLPKKAGTLPEPSLIPRERNDRFALVFEGFIEVPSSGIYLFHLNSEDGSRFWIGDTLVVDNGSEKSAAFEASGTHPLGAGRHRFRLEYFHNTGTEELGLSWSTLGNEPNPIPASAYSQADLTANTPPVVTIEEPAPGTGVLAGGSLLISASASDTDGITRVQFFGGSTFLGEDASPPYQVTWENLAVGTKTLTALAYDATGRWTASTPRTFEVYSPPPTDAISINFSGSGGTSSVIAFNEQPGAVHAMPYWNNLEGTSGANRTLTDQAGSPSTAQASWSAQLVEQNFSDTATANGRMLLTYIASQDNQPNPWLEVRDVPFAEYDVFVYSDYRRNHSGDTLPMRIRMIPTDGGPERPSLFLRNNQVVSETTGDYPLYPTWLGFREATATSPNAPDSQLLGNHVVFRNQTARGFRIEAANGSTGNRRALNAVQIISRTPSLPRVRVIEPPGEKRVTEGGPGSLYSLVLTVPPENSVAVTLSPDAQLALQPSTITFTPSNWSSPQTVVVSAVDDPLAEGPHSGVITHSIQATGNYSGADSPTLTLSIEDNDLHTLTLNAEGQAKEGQNSIPGLFVITRSGLAPGHGPITVAFSISGTATAGIDYGISGDGVVFNPATGNGSVTFPAGISQRLVILTPVDDSLVEGWERPTLTLLAGAGYTLPTQTSATLQLRDDDILQELFSEGFNNSAPGRNFDLVNRTLLFIPDGSPAFYRTELSVATAFPTSTSGHTVIDNTTPTSGDVNNGFWTINQSATFFGASYSQFHISSNGPIYFSAGSRGTSSSITEHFQHIRIAPFSGDLHPGQGGQIFYGRVNTAGEARSVITFSNVQFINTSADRVNFQVNLYDDGRIAITWLSCPTDRSFVAVGLSNLGSMAPSPFIGTDLSELSPLNPNDAPQFSTLPPINARVGHLYTYEVAGSDPDGDVPVVSASGLPPWLTFVPGQGGTGLLQGIPSASGTFDLAVDLSDGNHTTTQTFRLNVALPSGNTPPQFTSPAPGLVKAGSLFSQTITVVDADNQIPALAGTVLPSWLTLTDHGNGTATLSGRPPAVGLATYPVTLTAFDGAAITSQSFSLSLVYPPTLRILSPISDAFRLPDFTDALHLLAEGSDDGLPGQLTFEWRKVDGPGTVEFSHPAAHQTTARFSEPGRYLLEIAASDGAAFATDRVTVFAGIEGDAAMAAGLQGYWKFDESGMLTATDHSGSNRHATLGASGISMSPPAISGAALACSGDRASVAYNMPDQFTVSGWINPTPQTGTNDRHLFTFRGSGTRWSCYFAGGTSSLQIVSDRTTDGIWRIEHEIPFNEWTHLAIAYDNNTTNPPAVYVDGLQAAVVEISAPAGAPQRVGSFIMGGFSSAVAFIGRIDEVRIHERILAPAEVPALVQPGPMNSAPDVSAGGGMDVQPGSSITLDGAVSDDGFPTQPGAVSVEWRQMGGPEDVTLGSSSLPASSADLGSLAGSYTFRLEATDGDITVSSDVAFNATALQASSSFSSWILGYPAISGSDALPLADPDEDTLQNLAEFAFGGDPTLPDSDKVPRPEMVADHGNLYLELVYHQRRGGTGTPGIDYTVDGITYLAKASSTLRADDWSGGSAIFAPMGTPVDNGDGTETVRIRLLSPVEGPSAKAFIRLELLTAGDGN